MKVDLDFDWTKPDEENQADRLNRGKYAEFLTNYLSGYTDDSYVMNLNAEWGAGKTWFLKRWQQTIQSHHPTVYIDAWQNDFSDDPLLTVISGVFDALEGLCVNANATEYKKNALRKSGQFFKAFAKGVVQHQMEKHLGDGAELLRNGLDAVTDSAVNLVLQNYKQKLKLIEQFKEEIQNWLNLVSRESEHKKPMFVFIDELDRCRPTYAIELLETVKHLFDIPGLVFVVATNTDQLQHSIKAVYGQEFDAQRYLDRFFNHSFTLKKADLHELIFVQKDFLRLSGILESTFDGSLYVHNGTWISEGLAVIAESFDFDLRTTLKWLSQLNACISGDKANRYVWPCLALMLATKIKSREAFVEIFENDINPNQIVDVASRVNADYGLILPRHTSNRRLEFFTRVRYVIEAINEPKTNIHPEDLNNEFKIDLLPSVRLLCSLSSILVKDSIGKMPSAKRAFFPNYLEAKTIQDIQPNAAFLSVVHLLRKEQLTTKDNYLDLVNLASDLL
ncbi:MAG: KAP family NTPase [Saccharospirillaceae bacterium]|nr:KAP family NTPase [Saccharospirillaceae bacterium]MCD8531321.1 KAP family NTPase [Saccharospirillaceae bacterium]